MSALTLDTSRMFRPALDDLHGIDPAGIARLEERFPAVQAAISASRAARGHAFLSLGEQEAEAAAIAQWADTQRGRFAHLLLLGIGGSALGARAMLTALKGPAWNERSPADRGGLPTLTVLDNVDPLTVQATLERLAPTETLVLVISKSGGTAETFAQYLIVRQWLEQALGATLAREHLVIITDPTKGPLRAIARDDQLTAFPVPPAVGGRFSVLSPVGLVPAALLGIPVDQLLRGAAAAVRAADERDLLGNPAACWAALQWQAQVTTAANVHVLMPYGDALREFAEWFRQLWAESLGKRLDRQGQEVFRGPTPVGAIGATDQHSQIQLFMEGPFDKTITFLRIRQHATTLTIPAHSSLPPSMAYLAGRPLGDLLDAEFLATREALARQGRMSATIEVPAVTPATFGELIMFFQIATGFAGLWYDVDAFDQPGVELGKVLTAQAMQQSAAT